MSRYRSGGGNHHGSSSRSHGRPHDLGPVRFPNGQQRTQETSQASFNSQNFASTTSAQPSGSSILSMVAESLSKDNLTGGYQYLQPGWLNSATNGSLSSDGDRFRNQNTRTNYRSRAPLLPFPPGQEVHQNAVPQRHRQEPQYAPAYHVADEASTLLDLEQRMAEIQKQLDMLHEEEILEKTREAAYQPPSRHHPHSASTSSSFDPVSKERKDRELARMEQLLQKQAKYDRPDPRYEARPRNSPPRRRPRERSPRELRPPSRVNDARHSTRQSSRSREDSHHQKRRESPSPKRARMEGGADRRRREETNSGRNSVVSSGSGSRHRSEKREERRREGERKNGGSSRRGERPSSRGEKKEERKVDEMKPTKPAEKKVLKLDGGDSERRKRIMASLSSVSKRLEESEVAETTAEVEESVGDPLYKMIKEYGQELDEIPNPSFDACLNEFREKLNVQPKTGLKYRHVDKKPPYREPGIPVLEFFRRKPKDEKSFAVFQKICEERKASKEVKKEIKEEI